MGILHLRYLRDSTLPNTINERGRTWGIAWRNPNILSSTIYLLKDSNITVETMKISERIVEDMKVAMKGGDAKRVAALRTLRAALLQLQKSGAEVSEEDELKAIQKQAKMSKDAVEQFSTAGREDLAEKERSELAVFEDYLPKQMTDQEIEEVVKRIAGEVGASGIDDFKNVMPKAMSELKGRADGGRVQAIVRQVLSGDIGA